ncbi:MAG: hypothetical protein IAG13_13760 [Deltaproteobacteria bacterium]|nr:hypothetical protein [Nannocystaceae bacterium]
MSTHRWFTVALLLVPVAGCKHADKPDALSTYYDDSAGGLEPGKAPDAGAETPEPPETTDTPEETPPASAAFVPGPGGVPLPADAVVNTAMPTAGGKMSVHEIPRAKPAVVEELRANLAADGWTIDSEEVSPRYEALRLQISKDGNTVSCRVTGDDTKTAIIITLK